MQSAMSEVFSGASELSSHTVYFQNGQGVYLPQQRSRGKVGSPHNSACVCITEHYDAMGIIDLTWYKAPVVLLTSFGLSGSEALPSILRLEFPTAEGL